MVDLRFQSSILDLNLESRSMTQLRVAREIFGAFPDVLDRGRRLPGRPQRGRERRSCSELLRREEDDAVGRLAGAAIPEHPHIAPWREAYRKFGAKPKDHPSSIENLDRGGSIKGNRLPHINRLVDLYNAVSLRHLVPVGGEDLTRGRGRRRAALRHGLGAGGPPAGRAARGRPAAQAGRGDLRRLRRRALPALELEGGRPHQAHRGDDARLPRRRGAAAGRSARASTAALTELAGARRGALRRRRSRTVILDREHPAGADRLGHARRRRYAVPRRGCGACAAVLTGRPASPAPARDAGTGEARLRRPTPRSSPARSGPAPLRRPGSAACWRASGAGRTGRARASGPAATWAT